MLQTASKNKVDMLLASPIACLSSQQRNRRPKIACTQVNISVVCNPCLLQIIV